MQHRRGRRVYSRMWVGGVRQGCASRALRVYRYNILIASEAEATQGVQEQWAIIGCSSCLAAPLRYAPASRALWAVGVEQLQLPLQKGVARP